MGIRAFLQDKAGNLLGASWAAPIHTALFGTGAGDFHSPISFTATVTGENQITLSGSGLPSITNASQFRAVRLRGASGHLTGELYPSAKTPFFWDSLNSVLTIGGVTFGDVAAVDVEIHAEHRGYSPTESSWQQYRTNPEHAWTAQGTNSATAQGNGTTPYYYDCDTFKFWAVQIDDTPGATGDQTYTVWASWQDDGTAAGSCSYQNMTWRWFGVASITSADITADASAGVLEHDTPLTCKYIKLQVVRANDGAATDGAWDVHDRSTY